MDVSVLVHANAPAPAHTHLPLPLRLQNTDPSMRKRLKREALTCAIVSFPLMILAAAGFDIAFVIVSFYPNMAFFLGLEGVMPAYLAYRILIEVVLEAVPQVCLNINAITLTACWGRCRIKCSLQRPSMLQVCSFHSSSSSSSC
jgi:hypothetical protein